MSSSGAQAEEKSTGKKKKKRFKELLEQNLPSLILIFSDINSFSIQNLMMSGLWEEPVAVQEYWS